MKPLEKGSSRLLEVDAPRIDRKLTYKPFLTRMLFCCFSILLIMLTFFTTSSSAFAANNPHLRMPSSPHTLKPMSATNYIFPDWQFLGCGTGWNPATDPYLHYFKYAYTTGSQACSRAIWDEHDQSQTHTCDIIVYIPTILATANISYGLYRSDGSLIKRVVINQNNVYGWNEVAMGIYGVYHVLISSNNGQTGTYMAAGEMGFTCY